MSLLLEEATVMKKKYFKIAGSIQQYSTKRMRPSTPEARARIRRSPYEVALNANLDDHVKAAAIKSILNRKAAYENLVHRWLID